MSSWARVGVKCVCVDDRRGIPVPGYKVRVEGPYPARGEIYTIRAVWWDAELKQPLMSLKGLVRPVCPRTLKEGGWRLSRFRPLITKTQEEDVALFKSLLTGVPVGAEA